jgi:hypothetical protein
VAAETPMRGPFSLRQLLERRLPPTVGAASVMGYMIVQRRHTTP